MPHTITVFLPALLALLIPNTTANNTITYTNVIYSSYIVKKFQINMPTLKPNIYLFAHSFVALSITVIKQ